MRGRADENRIGKAEFLRVVEVADLGSTQIVTVFEVRVSGIGSLRLQWCVDQTDTGGSDSQLGAVNVGYSRPAQDREWENNLWRRGVCRAALSVIDMSKRSMQSLVEQHAVVLHGK